MKRLYSCVTFWLILVFFQHTLHITAYYRYATGLCFVGQRTEYLKEALLKTLYSIGKVVDDFSINGDLQNATRACSANNALCTYRKLFPILPLRTFSVQCLNQLAGFNSTLTTQISDVLTAIGGITCPSCTA